MRDTLTASKEIHPVSSAANSLIEQYRTVRQFSETLVEPLAAEDQVIQTMPEVSPAKGHLAHTTWFFETFVLKPNQETYRPLNPQYAFLFNSYYNAVGKQHPRPQRGLISRPTVSETMTYRRHVDASVLEWLGRAGEEKVRAVAPLVVLGLHHEQQHQELLLTDIKHVFSMNPLRPAYRPRPSLSVTNGPPALSWIEHPSGVRWIGHDGEGFSFDNEGPRHRVFIDSFALASRLVTNGEYLEFMEDNGYDRSELWLSLGWAAVRERGWEAPLYWEKRDGRGENLTLAGMRPIEPDEPVCHVSYFEADAFARWAGARLPTEAEWELAAEQGAVAGNFVEGGRFHPAPAGKAGGGLDQLYGDVWQWTSSAHSPYPGYKTEPGALGEYNGKFMCNQYVLRGASCVTSRSHARRTYRNFFPPDARWQFSGIRLARDTG
jgi:ergothioneine biosynthesis protein EgtB